jgi:hypothetical protein
MSDSAPRWRARGGWVAVALLLAVSLAANVVAGHAIRVATVNADTLSSLAVLRDVLADGGHIGDWSFGQHGDLFPDRLVTLAAYAIDSSPAGYLLAYGALNSLVLLGVVWLMLLLYRRASCGPGRAAEIAFLVALPATLLTLLLRSWGLFEHFFGAIDFPSWHFNQYLGAMLAAWLAIDAFDRPPSRIARTLLPAALLMLLCGLSDRLALFAILPFLVACLYHAVVAPRVRPGLPLAAAALGGAALAAYLSHDAVWRHIAMVHGVQAELSLASIPAQARILLGTVFPPKAPVQWLVAALLIAAALGLAGWLLGRFLLRLAGGAPVQRPEKADAMLVFLLAMFLLQPAVMLALGVVTGPVRTRYLYPALYAALLAVVARLGEAIPRGWPAGRVRGLAALACLAALLVPLPTSVPARIPTPPLVRCLDRVAESHAMALGLGYHWDTYVVDFLASRAIRVRSINGDGSIRLWADNFAWFAPDAARPPFSFVVLGGEIDEAAVRARYGAPDAVLDCAALGSGFGDRRILWYDAAGAARLTASVEAQYLAASRR